MRRSTGSPTGRYQAACGDGHCALQGGAGRSKLQGQIFTLLDLALGPGISDAPVATAIGRVNVDMLFRLGSGNIVVEYDGAYFHQHRARTDRIKADALRGRSKLLPAHVLRIREQPLPRLHHHNVLAPPRPTPQQCAQLALLHMLHTLSRSLPGGRAGRARTSHPGFPAGRKADRARIDRVLNVPPSPAGPAKRLPRPMVLRRPDGIPVPRGAAAGETRVARCQRTRLIHGRGPQADRSLARTETTSPDGNLRQRAEAVWVFLVIPCACPTAA